MTSVYNGQFYGNILVVGRTNCGKTTFIEKLGLNDFFGDIIKTEWMSRIDIDKQREAKIQSLDRVIIMDDISGVADISKNLANFLTVSRKSG